MVTLVGVTLSFLGRTAWQWHPLRWDSGPETHELGFLAELADVDWPMALSLSSASPPQ